MFKMIAVLCFLHINPTQHFCLANADVRGVYDSFEECNTAIDKLVLSIDQPMKQRLVAIQFTCIENTLINL